jgi:hypothetical protein
VTEAIGRLEGKPSAAHARQLKNLTMVAFTHWAVELGSSTHGEARSFGRILRIHRGLSFQLDHDAAAPASNRKLKTENRKLKTGSPDPELFELRF